jgi:hypothetical protein
MENPTAVSGTVCVGVIAFLVLRAIVDAGVIRWRSPLQSLLLVPQMLHFKPEPVNFLVETFLLFRYRGLRGVR